MTRDDLKRRIKVLEASRSAVEERRRFAHTRRKLTLDGLEAIKLGRRSELRGLNLSASSGRFRRSRRACGPP
jgi:hypothetical protein